jgi:hypothetical protein
MKVYNAFTGNNITEHQIVRNEIKKGDFVSYQGPTFAAVTEIREHLLKVKAQYSLHPH